MPALDPTLLSILSANSALPDLRPLAHELAQKHFAELAAEQAMVDRARQQGDELARAGAARSPYVQDLTRQATEPVSAFTPDQPGSFAPGAARDVGTLQDAMPPMPGPAPSAFNAPSSDPFAGVAVTDLRGARGGSGSVVDLTGAQPVEIGSDLGERRLGEPSPYSASAFEPSPMSRQEVAGQLARRPGGVSRGPRPEASGPRNAYELAAGEKLVEKVAARRQTEESSRRALQVEDLRGKSKGRDAQLSAATKLLMNLRDNATKLAVEMEKAKAIMAKKVKSGQDLKSLKDGWNLAREHADAAKSAVAMLYQAGAAGAAEGTPENANYQEALSESRRALIVAHEWERAYTDATNDVKTTPRVGGGGAAPGKTQKMRLDENGQLVPG